MGFRFNKIIFSPVELDFLKANRTKMDLNQLSLALAKSRNAVKTKLDELDGKHITKKKNKKSYIGKRKDLNQFCRSNWESNFLRYLNHIGYLGQWKYEPKVFSFTEFGIKHGTVSYCPDVKLNDIWIEIKGQLDNKSRAAINRFKKYYPEEFKKLQVVVGRPGTKADIFFKKLGVPVFIYYNQLEKEFKNLIKEWE